MAEKRQIRMENDLGRDDVRRLVRRIALPSMLAQFVSCLLYTSSTEKFRPVVLLEKV